MQQLWVVGFVLATVLMLVVWLVGLPPSIGHRFAGHSFSFCVSCDDFAWNAWMEQDGSVTAALWQWGQHNLLDFQG